MKFWQSAVLAALSVGIAAPAFAAGGTVSYVCQQNRQIDVSYRFNQWGKPVSARARLAGSQRNMTYDARRSDSMTTAFKDRAGFNLVGPLLTASNYRRESGVSIFSPNSEFLFKDCSPRRNTPSRQALPAGAGSGNVAYVCQHGRRLNVQYQFNSAGIPTHALLKINNRNLRLPYDLSVSDNVDTVFNGNGYRLATGSMDSANYRSLDVMLTAPNGELLYKGCSPAR